MPPVPAGPALISSPDLNCVASCRFFAATAQMVGFASALAQRGRFLFFLRFRCGRSRKNRHAVRVPAAHLRRLHALLRLFLQRGQHLDGDRRELRVIEMTPRKSGQFVLLQSVSTFHVQLFSLVARLRLQ